MDFSEYNELTYQLGKDLDAGSVEKLIQVIEEAYENNKQVFIIGNGGSGANASHLCEDLAKGTLHDFENQKRLKAISLTDNTPAILAWGNDTSYDRIFLEQMRSYANEGDLLISISGSGNSANVLRAVEWSKEHGHSRSPVTTAASSARCATGRCAWNPSTWARSKRSTGSCCTTSSRCCTRNSNRRLRKPSESEGLKPLAEREKSVETDSRFIGGRECHAPLAMTELGTVGSLQGIVSRARIGGGEEQR
jgi:phosphoheptose isomerase